MRCDAQVPVSFVRNASPGAATHTLPILPLAVEDDVLFFLALRRSAPACHAVLWSTRDPVAVTRVLLLPSRPLLDDIAGQIALPSNLPVRFFFLSFSLLSFARKKGIQALIKKLRIEKLRTKTRTKCENENKNKKGRKN